MSGNNNNTQNKGGMSKNDASRIQATQAKGGKDTSGNSFAARAQSAGDKNANVGQGQTGGAKK